MTGVAVPAVPVFGDPPPRPPSHSHPLPPDQAFSGTCGFQPRPFSPRALHRPVDTDTFRSVSGPPFAPAHRARSPCRASHLPGEIICPVETWRSVKLVLRTTLVFGGPCNHPSRCLEMVPEAFLAVLPVCEPHRLARPRAIIENRSFPSLVWGHAIPPPVLCVWWPLGSLNWPPMRARSAGVRPPPWTLWLVAACHLLRVILASNSVRLAPYWLVYISPHVPCHQSLACPSDRNLLDQRP